MCRAGAQCHFVHRQGASEVLSRHTHFQNDGADFDCPLQTGPIGEEDQQEDEEPPLSPPHEEPPHEEPPHEESPRVPPFDPVYQTIPDTEPQMRAMAEKNAAQHKRDQAIFNET